MRTRITPDIDNFYAVIFFQEMQDSGKYNENFPGHRFESPILIQTQIRLNPISTLATKHLLIIEKNNLYLRLKVF